MKAPTSRTQNSQSISRLDVSIQRMGVVLEPIGTNEADGVLNPASAQTRDGRFLLFPRCVAAGNVSRIGKVLIHDDGRAPERLGYVLEPQGQEEHRPEGGYGTEDARVTYVEPLDLWVMGYVRTGMHNGESGCRVGIAVSSDGEHYERLGTVEFPEHLGLAKNDKDAAFFPRAVLSPSGVPSIAFYHRPMPDFAAAAGEHWSEPILRQPFCNRQSIRIAYVPLDAVRADISNLLRPTESVVVMYPDETWGGIKLGAGSPPVLTAEGWMSIYHGIDPVQRPDGSRGVRYSAGIVIHDAERPDAILYRSPAPILMPETPEELLGTVNNVVFPTTVRQRLDLGERLFDVFYGMADKHIGAFRLHMLKRPRRNGPSIRQIVSRAK